jgi:hypothetical protein
MTTVAILELAELALTIGARAVRENREPTEAEKAQLDSAIDKTKANLFRPE